MCTLQKWQIKSSFQYVVYDHNSFIADVGGFLGLLLGHSILSVYATTYDLIEGWIKKGMKIFGFKGKADKKIRKS